MVKDYTNIAETAQRLVDKYGRSITLKRHSETPADASKPWEGPDKSSPAAEVTTKGVFVSPGEGAKLGLAVESDDLLQRSEQIAIVAPGPSETEDLATFDELEDTEIWRVVKANKLQPAGTAILYFIGVRR